MVDRASFHPEVLVVDDEEPVRQVLAMALPHYGLAVRLARGGAEAVATYEQHRGTVGVVLLDVQMPGTDGPETLAALQKLNPAVRAVFMTGDIGRYDPDGLLRRGAAGVVLKPFLSLEKLADLLKQLAS